MRKLNRKKVRWILLEMDKGDLSVYAIARIQRITPRWVRELHRRYLDTGEYPYPGQSGRRAEAIVDEERKLVLAMKEKHPFSGACIIEKLLDHEGVHIPHNRIHGILKGAGMARNEPKKQKRRGYIRYERKHSNSLWHTDWFEKGPEERNILLYEDDASRFITGGDLFRSATAKDCTTLLEESVGEYGRPKQLMSDHGTQFTSLPREGCPEPMKNEFQRYLETEEITHIKARVKHPQSNGKVERAGGTVRKLAAHFGSMERALEYYNFERPHWSLNIDECETPFRAYLRKMWPSRREKFVKVNLELVSRYAPEYLDLIAHKHNTGG